MEKNFVNAQKLEQKKRMSDYPDFTSDFEDDLNYEFEDEEDNEDDELHDGHNLDPAFSSWHDVNAMFYSM